MGMIYDTHTCTYIHVYLVNSQDIPYIIKLGTCRYMYIIIGLIIILQFIMSLLDFGQNKSCKCSSCFDSPLGYK